MRAIFLFSLCLSAASCIAGLCIAYTGAPEPQSEPLTIAASKPADRSSPVPVALVAGEDSEGVPVRCQLPIIGGEKPVLLWLINHGAEVQAGDVVAKLNPSAVQDELRGITSELHFAEADLVKATAALDYAKIGLVEYKEGIEPLQQKELEVQLIAMQNRLKRAEASKAGTEEAKQLYELAETKLRVHREFTREKKLQQLSAELRAAEGQLQAQEAHVELLKKRRDQLVKSLKSCQITASMAGQVKWTRANLVPGVTVVPEQVLLEIHEATDNNEL